MPRVQLQFYACLCAYLIIQLLEIPEIWGSRLLDKLRFFQARMTQEYSLAHWIDRILDENSGQLYLHFGSSYKTSDFRVDNLQSWWTILPNLEQQERQLIQLKIDNGLESSGIRTQFLKRIVDFSDEIGRPIQILHYPPYHSKYNPIERCWGVLEQHWSGTLLQDIQTLLGWAQSMTWKGIHPKVWLNSKTYKKGISLSKQEMRDVEDRLERNPELPKWDILIQPANR